MPSLPTFTKGRFMGLVAVLSFGLTALFTVLELGVLGPVVFIVGFFMVLPLVAILGEEFPLVVAPADDDADRESAETDPVETLRERYASGEIDEAEFERRLDRVLETEGLDGGGDPGGAGERRRERERARE